MIPSPLVFAVLALAAHRSYRLAALDTFPPLVAFRSWLVGSFWVGSEQGFRRPRLAEWLGCIYCSGLWWAAGWYGSWLAAPRWSLYAAVPLALSAAVALLQRVSLD